MKSAPAPHTREEYVLRLTLPTSDSAGCAKRLARGAALVGHPPARQQLHCIHYDTPDGELARQHAALWLQDRGARARPRWQRVFALEEPGIALLGRRRSWTWANDSPVPPALALSNTPWRDVDPDRTLAAALAPSGELRVSRTVWRLHPARSTLVTVTLDVGQLQGGASQREFVDLELAVTDGSPEILFDLAAQVTHALGAVPSDCGVTWRALALRQPGVARCAQAPVLQPDDTLAHSAQRVLGEMYRQFTANLALLPVSDDPEVVHQARIGWRRWRAAWRIFRAGLPDVAQPPGRSALQPLLTLLGAVRDLDVARIETLPRLAPEHARGDARRIGAWQALEAALLDATRSRRKALHHALRKPAVGRALLDMGLWIEQLAGAAGPTTAGGPEKSPLRRWARERMARLHDKVQRGLKHGHHDEHQMHLARIQAKRLRYGIEVLRPLLPKRKAQAWYRQAVDLQAGLGRQRDVARAAALAAQYGAQPGLVDFLRNVAAGSAAQRD